LSLPVAKRAGVSPLVKNYIFLAKSAGSKGGKKIGVSIIDIPISSSYYLHNLFFFVFYVTYKETP